MPEAELPIRRPAPLVSPAETPELAHMRAPAAAIPVLSSEDDAYNYWGGCASSRRTRRDGWARGEILA